MAPIVELRQVTRGDVGRLAQWLQGPEIVSMWFGRDASGDPIHLGYSPGVVLKGGTEAWERTFSDPRRHIFSVCTPVEGEGLAVHVGEAQMVIEHALGNVELSVLIGRRELWNRGLGTATMQVLLDMAFREYGAYRVWVDVPDDNKPSLRMCEKLGFVAEGRLRESRPRGTGRCDSIIMSLLAGEYAERMERALLAAA